MKKAPNERSVSTATEPAHSEEGDCALRCACGSLIARQVAGGIELKCRRCKRTIVVPLASGDPP
jgi:hypothetical protein